MPRSKIVPEDYPHKEKVENTSIAVHSAFSVVYSNILSQKTSEQLYISS